MKEDTQHLVRDSVGKSTKSKKFLKIFAVICACSAISFGTYKMFSHDDYEVTERESDNEEIALSMKVDDIPFVAVPGSTCGVHNEPSEKPFSSDVIGGGQAVKGMFTWHASLVNTNDTVNYRYCAATIISDRWLITSAECIKEVDAENLYIHVGSLSRDSSGIRHYIEKIVEHRNILSPMSRSIGLIKTATPIGFYSDVQPICLPPTDLFLEADSEIWTSGHGEVEWVGTDVSGVFGKF